MMDGVGSRLWLFGIISILHSFITMMNALEIIEAARNRTTAMKLIFLKSYEERVESSEVHRVDDKHRYEFMDKWSDILGDRNANRILKQLESHWMYTLSLANSVEEDITAMVLNIHVKITSMIQGMSNLICVMYYKRVPNGFVHEYCRDLATHLIIFGTLGTRNIIERFLPISSLRPREKQYLRKFLEDAEEICQFAEDHIRVEHSLEQVQDVPEDVVALEPETSRRLYRHILFGDVNINKRALGRSESVLLLTMMFGILPKDIQLEGYENCLFDEDREVSLWENFKSIDEYLSADNLQRNIAFIDAKRRKTSNSEDSYKAKYDIVDAIRHHIIKRAEMLETERRRFIEVFEGLVPNRLNIFIAQEKIFNNVELQVNNCQHF